MSTVAPPPPPAPVVDFRQMMMKIQAATKDGKLTEAQVNAALAGVGLKPEEMARLINNAPLIAIVNAAVDACIASNPAPTKKPTPPPPAVPAGPPETTVTPSERFPIYTFDEIIARPRLRWAIKGILPVEGVAAVYGPPGSGKSFLLFDMLAAVAMGSHWFGRRVKKSPVLYIALEGAAGFQQRAEAYAKKFGTKPAMLFITEPLDICKPEDVAALIEAIRAKGWQGNGVIAVDTLNAATPGADENSSEDMGAAIAGLKVLQRTFGGVVVAVHHTGKDISKGLRGHSSLLAALDVAIEVAKGNAGPSRTWTTAKVKDGPDDTQASFTLESVYLGKDDEGDPVTSCVVKPSEAAPKVADDLKGLGGNQRAALETLNEMFLDPAARVSPPDEVPAGKPYVSWEAAKAKIGPKFNMEKKRQRTEAGSVLHKLVESGRLATGGEYLWPVADVGPPPARSVPS